MSHYFRSAATCDPSTAVLSPVPLFNEPLYDEATPTEEIGATTASEVYDTDPFRASRAALDRTETATIRRDVRREANVLSKLAQHEERQKQRLAQEAALNEKLRREMQQKFGRAAPVDLVQSVEPKCDSLEQVPPNQSACRAQTSADMQCSHAVPPPIPVFEMIKIEEERQVRRALLLGERATSGSITTLYNELTLAALKEEHPDLPPTVVLSEHGDRFVPRNPAKLLEKSYGAAEFDTVQRQADMRQHELKQKLDEHRRHESAALADLRQKRALRDAESSTILQGLIEQDILRRTMKEELDLLRLAQHHQSALVGSFAVDSVETQMLSDPTAPAMPRNVLEALHLAKRPVHPVDAYQASVRADMTRRSQ